MTTTPKMKARQALFADHQAGSSTRELTDLERIALSGATKSNDLSAMKNRMVPTGANPEVVDFTVRVRGTVTRGENTTATTTIQPPYEKLARMLANRVNDAILNDVVGKLLNDPDFTEETYDTVVEAFDKLGSKVTKPRAGSTRIATSVAVIED